MSNAIIAYGATTERSVDGVTWAVIPECTAVAIPAVETEYKEVTNLDSPGRFREYIAGMDDAGVITLPANFTPAGYATQLADKALRQPIHYRTTLAPAGNQTIGDSFRFQGFPNPKMETTEASEVVRMSIEIRLTGDVDHTPGS
jgi:hypothetical protein